MKRAIAVLGLIAGMVLGNQTLYSQSCGTRQLDPDIANSKVRVLTNPREGNLSFNFTKNIL